MFRFMLIAVLLGVLGAGAAVAVGDTAERINPSPSAILGPWGMSALPMDQFKGSGIGNTVTIERRPHDSHTSPHPHPAPHRSCYWINGGYRWTVQRFWVPDQWQQQYVPPVFEPRWINGQQVWVMVMAERYETVLVPGHYEEQQVQVWVPGRWVCFCGRHHR
jgi:hypothetical protein